MNKTKRQSEFLQPAAAVIKFFGDVALIGKIVGRDESRIYRWRIAKGKGGTDGVISARDATLLLQYARQNDLNLLPDDFYDSSRLEKLQSENQEVTQ